jgi:hypothetical protein
MVFGLFGVYWVMPNSIVELIECWQGSFGKHRNYSIWHAVPHCLMWSIWRERYGRCFEDCERSYVEIKLLFLRSLFDWVAGWESHFVSSLFHFFRALFVKGSLILYFLVYFQYTTLLFY